jgi:predicted AlkP superfamily pyrophosphatase or phosphodiesterase
LVVTRTPHLRFYVGAVLLLLWPVAAWRQPGAGGVGAGAPAPRFLLITIDGLRADVLLRADTPNIRRLMARGAYTMWARTVPECYTLPAHVSILTGVAPQKHGVEWNDHIEEAYSLVPTLFEVARRGGLSTAMVTGKTKFVALDKPGTIDWKFLPRDEPNPDAHVARQAVSILRRHRPHVMLVHLADTDTVGHAVGWGTPEQLRTVEEADRQVGVVLDEVARLGLADSTLVVLTSDHGGAGLEHGPEDPRSRHIPWIVAGPGVRRDFDLTRSPDLTVDSVDTFPMACAFLRLREGAVEGKVPWPAFTAPRELLRERRPARAAGPGCGG